jgi:hypothetical protein
VDVNYVFFFQILSESVLCLNSVEYLVVVVGYSMVSKTRVSGETHSVGPNISGDRDWILSPSSVGTYSVGSNR